MRRAYPPLLLLCAGAAAILLFPRGPRTPARQADQEPADEAPPPARAFREEGVGSCASTACHHGNGPRGARGSEYTTWANHDPHARAYSVLFDERSRTIQANL